LDININVSDELFSSDFEGLVIDDTELKITAFYLRISHPIFLQTTVNGLSLLFALLTRTRILEIIDITR